MSITSTCVNPLSGTSAQLFLTLLNTLYASRCSIKTDYQEDYGPKLTDDESFDFIVVGGGTAGSIVAARLSENPNWKILVLEAGEFPPSDSEVPGIFATLQKTEFDWQFQGEPSEKSCLGFKDGKCNFPRGKLLGGSSSINGMLYMRGDSNEFDLLESLGNPGWDKQNALKYFKKLENVQNVIPGLSYGTKGPVKISLPPKTRIHSLILKAAHEAGIKIHDYEGSDGIAVGLTTIADGKRSSTARAYISKARSRNNLHVAVKSHVNKLLISDNKISGLEVLVGNEKLVNLKIENEAIISAGAINSPKLLQLSGIGPKDFIVDPIIDLPVGKNFYDPICHFGSIIKLNPTKEVDNSNPIFDYFIKKEGPLATVGLTNLFWNIIDDEDIPRAVYFFHFPANDTTILPIFLRNNGYNEITAKSIIEHNKKYELLQLASVLSRPKSHNGFVAINSNQPGDAPKVNPGYLENEEDLNDLLGNINNLRKFLETETFKSFGAEFLDFQIPNCAEFEFDGDEYWKCNIRNFATTLYQHTGTCKMGTNSDDSVVDPRLKVHGVENLRVIDASVLPPGITPSMMGPTMMIGEKGADLIKEDWDFIQT